MKSFSTLASATALATSLVLTGCGSDDSSGGDSKSSETESASPSPTPLTAASARQLTDRLIGSFACENPQRFEGKDVKEANDDMGTTLLDGTFCSQEKPRKVAYFVTVSEKEADSDAVVDFFEKQAEEDKVDLAMREIRGDGWQVLAMAEKELPEDIDETEAAIKEAAGR